MRHKGETIQCRLFEGSVYQKAIMICVKVRYCRELGIIDIRQTNATTSQHIVSSMPAGEHTEGDNANSLEEA